LGGGGGGTPEVDETDEVNVAGVAFCEVFLFGDFASFFTVLHCATTGLALCLELLYGLSSLINPLRT